jgi:hypothetical protein
MSETYLASLKRPSRNCLLCGVSLPELERHPTIMNLDEKEQAIRQDICPRCWSDMGKPEYFSYWITRRFQEGPSPEQRRLAKAERNEALWALFNALYTREETELGPQIFLLAHLLMRARILQYTGPNDEGLLTFLHPKTQEAYQVRDIPLNEVPFHELHETLEKQLHEYAPPPQKPDSAEQ